MLAKVSTPGADGKVDEAAVILEIGRAGGETPVDEPTQPKKPETYDEVRLAKEKAFLDKAESDATLAAFDVQRVQNMIVEVEEMKIVGAAYIRRLTAALNNMSSELAPMVVGVKNKQKAKEIIDEKVAKTINEWRNWDIDKIASEKLKSVTHRRAGTKSWRTETKG